MPPLDAGSDRLAIDGFPTRRAIGVHDILRAGCVRGDQSPPLALIGRRRRGRPRRLCPLTSDIHLFRYSKWVIDFDPEISNGALDLRVTEK